MWIYRPVPMDELKDFLFPKPNTHEQSIKAISLELLVKDVVKKMSMLVNTRERIVSLLFQEIKKVFNMANSWQII